MADIRPFRALRPARSAAENIAALPYDVYTREEAALQVQGRPLSFLNIDRPETAFPPDYDMYAPEVYAAGAERLKQQAEEGYYIRDGEPCFYIYELTMNGRSQTGIAALSSAQDYLSGICRRHENTTVVKENDRICHVKALSAQTGPVFLSYHAREDIRSAVNEVKTREPEYAFVSEDGIGHRVWCVPPGPQADRIEDGFAKVERTYIADGHHRAASAVKVALEKREDKACPGTGEAERFLSVLFPDDELMIMDYNRVVKDLNGLSEEGFLSKLSGSFDILRLPEGSGSKDLRPEKKHGIGMYLNGRFYQLQIKEAVLAETAGDPVEALDVSMLQNRVLEPMLGIQDPRTDSRIRFVGGIRGMEELKALADSYTAASTASTVSAASTASTAEAGEGEEGTAEAGEAEKAEKAKGPAVAFAMYPTSMQELFRVADAGLLMPPKSTWFEPKLRSGLFIHEI